MHWTDKLYNRFDDIYDRISYEVDLYYELFYKKLNKWISKFDKLISKIYDWPMYFYGLYRIVTFPTNYVFIYTWKYLIRLFKVHDLLLQKGIHVVMSPPGGGKTLSAWLTIEMLYEKYGYQAYINSSFEKPREDDQGRRITHHTLFNFDDVYGVRNVNGKLQGYQKKRFNPRKGRVVVWDELHMMFNPRENRSSIYMLAFKPWLDNILAYRHENFHSHILLSQLKVDIQVASIATYIHRPTTIIDINYGLWMKTGQFKMVPVKIKYETFKFADDKMKLYRRWSRRVDYDLLEYYETLALKNARKNIPLLN